jgi:hypothetical protein
MILREECHFSETTRKDVIIVGFCNHTKVEIVPEWILKKVLRASDDIAFIPL